MTGGNPYLQDLSRRWTMLSCELLDLNVVKREDLPLGPAKEQARIERPK